MTNSSRRIDIKPFVFLAIGLACWWILPGVVRGFFKETFYEFQAPLLVAQSRAEDVRKFWTLKIAGTRNELIEAGRDMARINAALSLRVAELKKIEAENRRLEKMFGIPSRPDYRTIIARVARRDLNTWWQEITLRKGSADGIRENCPVVVAGNVVGRVRKVRLYTCEVELVTSPDFRISANIDGDDRPVIYAGGTQNMPFSTPSGNVTHIPSNYEFPHATKDAPLQVFTSGLGGVFPGGYVLGTVSKTLVPTDDGLFLSGRVTPSADLATIEEAAVLVAIGDFRDESSAPAPARQ